MKQLLGIYIPTYNRKEKLTECLDSLLSQASRRSVPIYISDNASTDGTEQLVKNLKNKYPKIYYKRNGANLGYPSNIISLLKMGNTEFMWFFGDDDKFKPDAIDSVLKYINSGYDFLQINSDTYDNNLMKKLNNRSIHINHDLIYEPGDHNIALINAGYYAGFISGMITKRSFLIKELKKLNKKATLKLEYIQTILFYRSIINKTGILIAKPLFSMRATLKFPKRGIEHQFKNYPETIEYLKVYYEESTLDKFEKPNAILTTIFMSKRDCPKMAKANMRYLLGNNQIGYVDKLLGSLILMTPNSLINIIAGPLKKLYHSI